MRLGCRGDDAGRRALLQPVEEEAANLRTEACDERSAMNVATVASLPAADLMRADAMRVLVLLRPTMARFAPSAASASAAANPMPLVAPVIRICLSFTAQQSKAMANAQDDLFEVKDLALDQSQPTTSPILKNSAPSIGLRRRPGRAGQARCRTH